MATVTDTCIGAMEAAIGRKLSKEEANDLTEELDRRILAAETSVTAGDLTDKIRAAADDYAKEMAANAVIMKRNKALQLKVHLEGMDKIRSQFGFNTAVGASRGVESVINGVSIRGKGTRNSAALAQTVNHENYLQGIENEHRKAGILELFNSGTMDREIARAKWAIERETPEDFQGPMEAMQSAKIISKWQEKARDDANKSGAYIKKIEGYITRQSHDIYAIRSAGFPAWRDAILPKLDTAKTFEGADPEEFLKGAWQGLASGVHMKTAPATGMTLTRNVAKGLSQERVLHFKDADSWFDYNEQFGLKSIRESVNASLSRLARDTGLMRFLGPNPELGFDRLTKEVMGNIKDPKQQSDFKSLIDGKLRNRLKEVTGQTRIPGSAIGAEVASVVRGVTNMAKLGFSIASQLGDVPVYASEMKYQGRGFLSGMAESLGAVGMNLSTGDRRDVLSMLGVYFDSMSGGVVNRFSHADDGIPGYITKMQQRFFRLNLLSWWSDHQKASAVLSMSHHLALNADKEFGALNEDLRNVLGLYGIGEGQWNVLKGAVHTAEDERRYLAPELIESLPDAPVEAFLTAGGIKPTPNRITSAKREIADQVRGYLIDRASYAQLTPDARTRSVLTQGTRPGTVFGEAARFIGQFKSFSVAMAQKVIGREIYGRGLNADARFWNILQNGGGGVAGVANILAWSMLFGYASMTAKDLVKGRTPRPPLDWQTFVASMAQSGGLGIYGDFLFGSTNRFGGSLLSTVAGPTAGTASDIYDIFATLRDQSTGHPEREAAAKMFRVALNNTPYVNLFYVKPVMDYLILNRIAEALSPGYLRRLEKRVQKDNSQTFLMRPSATFPQNPFH